MCLVKYWSRLKNWWHEPNKEWFKLAKFGLSVMRAMLFIAFGVVILVQQLAAKIADHEKDKTAAAANSTTAFVPLICLYVSFIYNWRFLVSLVILAALAVYCLCVCCCWFFSCCCMHTHSSVVSTLRKLLRTLHWSSLDWPCLLRLKYYLYIFDIVHYLAYLVSALVIGFVQLDEANAMRADATAVDVFMFNSLLFAAHIGVEVYRVVQAQRVQRIIRDIFSSDVKFDRRAVMMIAEDQLGSLVCPSGEYHCASTDTQHRAFAHPKEVFKRPFAKVSRGVRGLNIQIGFHQTTIEAAKSILTTSFRASPAGMIGPGIYFANNYDITEHKRNQSTEGGAIFCARIDMGRVCEIHDKNDNRADMSAKYDSKYLHHTGGDKYDEFVVYDPSQILEYTIVVESDAIENYRRASRRTCCCGCINY